MVLSLDDWNFGLDEYAVWSIKLTFTTPMTTYGLRLLARLHGYCDQHDRLLFYLIKKRGIFFVCALLTQLLAAHTQCCHYWLLNSVLSFRVTQQQMAVDKLEGGGVEV